MNPNNELLQAAKDIEACPRIVHAEYIGAYQVPSHLMDALRKAIARAEASASQPAAVPGDLVARLREIWDLAERGLGYKAPFGYVKDAADEIERLNAIIASQPAPDEQREKAIEAWHERMDDLLTRIVLELRQHGHADGIYDEADAAVLEADRLMRSAPPPAPAVPSEAEIEAWKARCEDHLRARMPQGNLEVAQLFKDAHDLMRRAAGGAS